MIETPTVLILGAGASIPYEYHSGEKLIEEISKGILPQNSLFKLLIKLDYSKEFINKFKQTLRNSGSYSIDTFLENWPKYNEIGKIAIAHILILAEWAGKNSLIDFGNKDNWYRYLYKHLNCHSFEQNKIGIITFNYDKSLEQYLFTALNNSYEDLDENKCASKIRNIPIVHVHGKLDES